MDIRCGFPKGLSNQAVNALYNTYIRIKDGDEWSYIIVIKRLEDEKWPEDEFYQVKVLEWLAGCRKEKVIYDLKTHSLKIAESVILAEAAKLQNWDDL